MRAPLDVPQRKITANARGATLTVNGDSIHGDYIAPGIANKRTATAAVFRCPAAEKCENTAKVVPIPLDVPHARGNAPRA